MPIKLAQCSECTLQNKSRVFGRGNPNKPWIAIVGEAPGRQEEEEGEPFVGMAGQLLEKVLAKEDIPTHQVYITNTCLCRPPENRDPTAKEVKACWPRLEQELTNVQPLVIVAVGKVAARAVLDVQKLSENRGKVVHTQWNVPGLATYHPAACLYAGKDTMLPSIMADLNRARRIALGERLPYSDPHTAVHVIRNRKEMESVLTLFNMATDNHVISYDWETTGTNPMTDEGVCLAFTWREGRAYVVPVELIPEVRDLLDNLFTSGKPMAYNAMFDMRWNKAYGLFEEALHDPMLMHYCLDERPQSRSLENLSGLYCDAPAYETQMLAEYGANKDDMTEVIPKEVIYEYCGKDVDWAYRLSLVLAEELRKQEGPKWAYKRMLIPAANAFRDIQDAGFYVDQNRLSQQEIEYIERITQANQQMQEILDLEEFNPNSHKQVQWALWEYYGLEQPRFYGRKDRSADKATREALLEKYPDHPFLLALDEYKDCYTMWSRYLKGLKDHIDPDDRIRCQYHLDRTETGRLSTTKPAIHQIPRDSGIRSIFAAEPGNVLIQADYEQAEIRMAAHIAGDEKLTRLLQTDSDFHSMMAAQAFRKNVEEVTKQERQAAKAVSFGLLYLMGDQKLAANTGLPAKEAEEFVKRYKAMMPEVWKWIESVKKKMKLKGHVESIFGRRRRFMLLTRDNFDSLHREAVNMLVQSAASDLTLSKVIEMHNYFKHVRHDAQIVAMVHDSIVVECPEQAAPVTAEIMKEIMEKPPFETSVPFPVEVKIGKRWGEGEKLRLSTETVS